MIKQTHEDRRDRLQAGDQGRQEEALGRHGVVTLRSTVAGTLTITGSGVKKTKRDAGAGEHQIKVALTSAGRHRKKIKLKIVLKERQKHLSKLVDAVTRAFYMKYR